LKRSLGARLALSYLAVLLVGVGLVIPLAWLAVERLYLNAQEENLLAQAQLVAAALGSQVPPATSPGSYTQLSNVLPGIHTRVIDPLGAVVIDLTAPEQSLQPSALTMPQLAQNASGLVTPAELVSRPEIAQARLGQPATAIRRVEVAGGQRVLYAAAPVLSGDGNVLQIVYLATPLPDTQWNAFPIAVRWQFGAVILASILLASLVGLLLSRRISRPLEKLAGAAHAVAAGDLGQTVPEDPEITELAMLGRAFNTMTTSLRHTDQAKTAFISDVSHELRTPLTVIKGTIETLQDGALDDLAARGSLLTSMARETERLITLVNDLLVLTRADAGALNLQRVLMDLGELARSRCEHFERAASLRQVSLRTVTNLQPAGQHSYSVFADPDRIAQVLDNLIDNAIRYSPPGAEVTVTLVREADQVACRVTDAGPGIPSEHLPFIFERFYRANQARGRGEGGSGLGLSIARGLVQAHAGRTAASSVEGQGTTVTFWLPAAKTDT
jgi:signal transduction histidine kinase